MQPEPTFKSLDRLSEGIQYAQLVIARLSALFLMLSLITATWNLLVKDALFRLVPVLEWVWGLAQAVAVDSALAVVFVRMALSIRNKEYLRGVVYGVIGLLLLFVAVAIVDVESLRQALDITLTAAAGRLPFNISIEFLTQVRSVVVGLLIAVSGFELVVRPVVEAAINAQATEVPQSHNDTPEPASPSALPATSKTENAEKPKSNTAQISATEPDTNHRATGRGHTGNGRSASDAFARLADFYALRPDATKAETKQATGISETTIARYRRTAEYVNRKLNRVTSGVGSTEDAN